MANMAIMVGALMPNDRKSGMDGSGSHGGSGDFPSGAVVVLVVAAVAVSSVLVTLVWLVVNNRRRRMRPHPHLPELVTTRRAPFPSGGLPSTLSVSPSAAVATSPLPPPPLFLPPTSPVYPKPADLEVPPPTYEEAMSAPSSPHPLNPPSNADVDFLPHATVVRLEVVSGDVESNRRRSTQRRPSGAPPDYPGTLRGVGRGNSRRDSFVDDRPSTSGAGA